MAKTIETKITVGATSPFKIIHLADTHLTYGDMRDGERKVELAKKRSQYYRGAEEVLALASSMSKELSCPIFHTGDLSDFVSLANLERAKAFVDENDVVLSAGNHEFSQYVARLSRMPHTASRASQGCRRCIRMTSAPRQER